MGLGAVCEAGVVSQMDLLEKSRGMDCEVSISMALVSNG